MAPFRKSSKSDEFITLINGKTIRKEDVGKIQPRRPRKSEKAAHVPERPSSLRVKTLTDSIKYRGIMITNKKNKDDDSVKKLLRFDTLEVREFPIMLGDNPSVDDGPPLTIDWGFDPNTHFVLDVAQFEQMRGERRKADKLKLDRRTRERALLNTGTTQKEIAACIRKLRKDQHSRMVSRNQDDAMHEKVENASRRFKKLVTRKSQYERDLEAVIAKTSISSSSPDQSPTSVMGF